MKAFFSIVLSCFCLFTTVQAQSIDSPTSVNPIIDYLDAEGIEQIFGQLYNAASIEKAMAERPLGCACLGDINRDLNLNLLDVAPFVNAVQNGFNDPCADMNQDGVVDLLDVAPFIEELETGGCDK